MLKQVQHDDLVVQHDNLVVQHDDLVVQYDIHTCCMMK